METHGDYRDVMEFKLLFVGYEHQRWCVYSTGPGAEHVLEAGNHIEDCLYAYKDDAPPQGIIVFDGEAYWSEGSYEYPDDVDLNISGTWRVATEEEIKRLAEGRPIWTWGTSY